MSKYIDKEKLIQHIKDVPTWLSDDSTPFKYPDGMYDVNDVINSIENAPDEDVVPVTHAHWEVCDYVEYDGHSECVHHPKEGLWCSNCKNGFRAKLLYKRDYCPNCGAKMDRAIDNN